MESTMTKKSLSLDGVEKAFEGSMPFAAISQELKSMLGPDRVVTEIYVDNRPIDLSEEETIAQTPFAQMGDIVVKTRNVNELYGESLALAPKICEALKADVSDVVTFFKEGKVSEAQERVGEMTALLEWLLQLISGFQAIADYKLETMTFSKGQVMGSVDRMQVHLSNLHEDLTAQRWDAFEKTLTGDFVAEVDNWKALFEEVGKAWKPRTQEVRAS